MPDRLVVWDIDRTIVRSSLERHFLAHLRNQVDRFSMPRLFWNLAVLGLRLPPPAWYQVKLAYLRGYSRSEVDGWFRDCFERDVKPTIFAGASTAIRKLQIENVRQVLLSGTPRPFAERVRLHFGLSDIIAAEPEFVDAKYTGRLLQHHPHGEYKARYLGEWLSEHRYDWNQVTALADHFEDRFLLEKAAIPIAVNPSPELKIHAERCGWAIVPDAAPPAAILPLLERTRS